MTDDEFERFMHTVLMDQRLTAERERAEQQKQRAEEQQRFLLTRLPRYMSSTVFAEQEALSLQSEGADLDAIERQLFDGIARDAATWTVVGRVRELRLPTGGFGRCRAGTKALMAATLDGIDRGVAAGRATFTRIKTEADAFGRTQTQSALRAAGWQHEDINDE